MADMNTLYPLFVKSKIKKCEYKIKYERYGRGWEMLFDTEECGITAQR